MAIPVRVWRLGATATVVALASQVVFAADGASAPADDGAAAHVSIAFSGETIADKGLFGAVGKVIFDHRPDTACRSVEAVHAAALPPPASTGGFPRRSKPDNLRDDVYETWAVTMCGKTQSNLVRFAFTKDGGIDYWVAPGPAR